MRNPPSGTARATISVAISVPALVETNGSAVIYTGWTGTGSAPGSGTDTAASFTLTANTTLTWNWAPFVVRANVTPGPGGGQIMLQWPSLAGKSYDIFFATNLLAGFAPVAMDLPATPPNNIYQGAIGPAGAGFYKVKMK